MNALDFTFRSQVMNQNYMRKEIIICDRCQQQSNYTDEFTSKGELKSFELCDKCVYDLKKFLYEEKT